MFCGDLIEKIDLEPDFPESDNLSDLTTFSDPLTVNSTSDQTSDSNSFPDLKLGDKSISDVTDESAHLSGSSCNSSTTSNFTTPQSNYSCQPVVNDSSSYIAADIPLPGKPVSKPDSVHSDIIDAKNTMSDAFYTALDPVLSADPNYDPMSATGFVSSRSNFRAECSLSLIHI